jgi:hypothetical protein
VLDFVEFLAEHSSKSVPPVFSEWSERDFLKLSMSQVMRGLEDEPVIYTEADIKVRW